MSETNSAHAKNKGAFGWSCGGPSCGCSGQEAGHCEETAVLGVKPVGDVALGPKGTLFIPYPDPGHHWARAGPPRGLQVMGARVPERGSWGSLASSGAQAEGCWVPVGSPGHPTTHPDNTAAGQGLRPWCLIHVGGISADCGQRGLGHLFQVQQVPSGDHYEESGQGYQ